MSTCAVMLEAFADWRSFWEVEDRGFRSKDGGIAIEFCWIWKRGTSAGRPIYYMSGRGNRNAARVVWEACNEAELSTDTLLVRKCSTNLCVSPLHHELRPRRLGLPRRPAAPEDQRRWNLAKYGITPEQYDALLASQGGVCAVCRAPNTDRLGRRLHVDHDHETGAVRGLLCTLCNNAIGQAGESAARLRALASYLERSPSFQLPL